GSRAVVAGRDVREDAPLVAEERAVHAMHPQLAARHADTWDAPPEWRGARELDERGRHLLVARLRIGRIDVPPRVERVRDEVALAARYEHVREPVGGADIARQLVAALPPAVSGWAQPAVGRVGASEPADHPDVAGGAVPVGDRDAAAAVVRLLDER